VLGAGRHIAVDTGGLLAVVVTTASLQDRDGAFRITAALREAFSKRHRAVATRFDKLAVRYEATLHIATINDWLLTSL
jgi:hypothetical protein